MADGRQLGPARPLVSRLVSSAVVSRPAAARVAGGPVDHHKVFRVRAMTAVSPATGDGTRVADTTTGTRGKDTHLHTKIFKTD